MLAPRYELSRSRAAGLPQIVRLAPALFLSGILLAGGQATTARAQPAPAARPSAATTYADQIAEASQRFGIPAAWITTVLQAESAGDARAVSPKGAMGLMQLMPETWAGLRVRHGLGQDPFDPRDNILAGVAFLREMYNRYGSPGFLAAYHAGPGRYEQHLRGRPLPPETRAYLAALAPAIDGEASEPLSIAGVADPLAWRRAPLFVERSGRSSVAPRSQSGGQADDRPAAPVAQDQTDMAPQPTDLFVVRTTVRDRQ